ncbi:hypothetical protein H7F33_11005 [Pedobacter sp. PAMC26386]|nr:hypothetical protein H7F33_11005 [Pedobacter sp. PAMC26386]
MILSGLTYIIIALFILLWAYASIPKFRNIRYFKEVMESQAIPKWMAQLLTWLLPITELSIIGLLIFEKTRLIGMYATLIMMLAFTVYVGGIMFHVYNKYPCPCGGLFTRIGWRKHFKLNLILSALALIGVLLLEYRLK